MSVVLLMKHAAIRVFFLRNGGGAFAFRKLARGICLLDFFSKLMSSMLVFPVQIFKGKIVMDAQAACAQTAVPSIDF